jgi:hypothetical protein
MDYGYTYTTLTGRPGEAMRVDTAFYLDENAHIHLVGAGTGRAFLSIDHGEVSVIISPRPDVRWAAATLGFPAHLEQGPNRRRPS